METDQTFVPPLSRPNLELDLIGQDYLRQAGKWAGFLGIIGFIFTGIILLAAFFVGTSNLLFTRFQDSASVFSSAGVGAAMSLVYVLFALLYFFLSLFLFQFGSRIKKGLLIGDSNQVSSALGKLKAFFRLWGVLTIIGLCLYALIIIIVVAVGVGTQMIHR